MTRWAPILVAAAACAAAPPERLHNPKRIPHHDDDVPMAHAKQRLLVSAPNVDLSVLAPDFHDELRWPLTPMNHPVMEPKFPIAQELAQPGIGWTELCGSGVTNRFGGEKELLSYLRGWCKAVDGDTDAACSNLAPLMHSTRPRMEAAVRNDLANILAQDHAEKAEHYIKAHSLRDVALLDLLAANYVEVGTGDDAIAINLDAIASDDYAAPATVCMRDTKQIVLTGNKTSLLLKEVESLAHAPKNPDPVCVREFAKLQCWTGQSCSAHVKALGGGERDVEIVTVLQAWSSYRRGDDWWNLARRALVVWDKSTILSDQQLADIAVSAMHNGLEMDDGVCYPGDAAVAKATEKTMRPLLSSEGSQRLDAILSKCR